MSHSSKDWEVHDQAPADLMSGENHFLILAVSSHVGSLFMI